MEKVFIPQPKVQPPQFHGSANCRDANHWENILVNGKCESCKHIFSL